MLNVADHFPITNRSMSSNLALVNNSLHEALRVEFERISEVVEDRAEHVRGIEDWQLLLDKLERFIKFVVPLGNLDLNQEACDLHRLLSVMLKNALPIEQTIIERIKQKLAKLALLIDRPQLTSFEFKAISAISSEYPLSKRMPFRILLLDNHPLAAQRHELIFRKAGFSVDRLDYSELAALSMVNTEPDLLFVQACSLDGEACRRLIQQIREFDLNHPFPVLLVACEEQRRSLQEGLAGIERITVICGPLGADKLVEISARQINQLRMQKRRMQNLQRFNYEHAREQQAIDSHAIVSITNGKGDIIHVNDRFCQISGYSRWELLGNDHRLLKSGVHPRSFYQQMWRTILSGVIWQGEICNKNKDGGFYWVKASIIPFLDRHGKPYKYVSYRTDISNIKRTEEKTRLLLESLGEGVVGVNLEFQCTFINSAALKMLGCRVHDILNQDVRPFFCALQEVDGIISAQHNPVFQTMADQKTRCEEWLFYRKDGSPFPVELTITSHIDNDLCQGAQIVFHDISVRKQMERKLSISEERFRRAQNYANIGTWEWNIKTNALYWSDRVAPLFGYGENEQETCYEKFINAVHPDDRQMVEQAIRQCFDMATPYFVEHRVVWPDGQIRWVSEHGDVVRDTAGNPIRMLGLVQDINIRKQTEHKLKDSEERLSVAIEGAGDGIWDWNIATNEMQFSSLYAQMLGYQVEELKAHADTWIDSVHPDDLAWVKSNLDDYLNGTIPKYEIELRLRCKDNAWKWILCRGKIVNRDRHDKPIRMTGIHTDISARKKLEENLLLFRHIFETSEQFICVSNNQGVLIYINPALCKRLAYQASDVIGRHFSCLLPLHRRCEDARKIRHAIRKDNSWHGKLPIQCQDGSQFISSSNIGSIVDKEGKIQSIFNIFSDFGDELQRRKELAKAKELAERANQAKSEFLSSMSHELRTPMNAILGFAQILEFDDGLNPDQRESLNEIIKAGKHLLQLINEVLDLAKIESGHIDLSLEAVPLNDTLLECLTLIEPLAAGRLITIANSINPALSIQADLVRIKQVLLNLLSNAVKYNRQNGRIAISCEPAADGNLRIMIRDSGQGIAKHQLLELFQPFNRLAAGASSVEGTGIGLSITKKLVELMGGKIGVDSRLGEGSVFWFELPAATPQDGRFDSSQQPFAPSKTESGDALRRVLCIDDNPVNIKLIKQILAHHSHLDILTAHAPKLGIELALAYQPDLVLLDINMPGMNGYQVLRILQASPETQNIPVVAVTASAMKKDVQQGLEAGFSAYITKPFEIASFLQTLDQILNKV